jgi:hypothetical protein
MIEFQEVALFVLADAPEIPGHLFSDIISVC